MIRSMMIVFTLTLLAPLRADDAELATCKGNSPCKACKNCTACKYCHKDGGYCGACSKPIPESPEAIR
jgi:hypothetical protein